MAAFTVSTELHAEGAIVEVTITNSGSEPYAEGAAIVEVTIVNSSS